jgi:hypothetical protein
MRASCAWLVWLLACAATFAQAPSELDRLRELARSGAVAEAESVAVALAVAGRAEGLPVESALLRYFIGMM